jgi:thioesterase domain-containing protein
MEMLAARALAALAQIQPHGPYHLAGFCFGGVLAFELARQLADAGHEIGLLALLDATYVPGCRLQAVPWLRRAMHHGGAALREGPGYLRTKLAAKRRLKASRQQAVQYARLTHFEGDVVAVLPKAAFLRAILEEYVGQPYGGEAVVVRGVSSPSFSLDRGRASGWDHIVRGQVHVEEIRCGHVEICQEPNVGQVAKRLKPYFEFGRDRGRGRIGGRC